MPMQKVRKKGELFPDEDVIQLSKSYFGREFFQQGCASFRQNEVLA